MCPEIVGDFERNLRRLFHFYYSDDFALPGSVLSRRTHEKKHNPNPLSVKSSKNCSRAQQINIGWRHEDIGTFISHTPISFL